MENYNKLDVAAKLFPSVTGRNNSSVFRMSVLLTEKVDARLLQLSVNMIYERFSLFFLNLRRGVFWNYFDKNHVHFTVEEERKSPCSTIVSTESKGYIIKILYHANRISVEAFHSIADGSSVAELLKSLVYYYLCLKYGEFDAQGKVLLFDEESKNDEDSFEKHFGRLKGKAKKSEKVKKTPQPKEENAFRIKGKPFRRKGLSVVSAVFCADEVKKYCKSSGCSITALLAANLIMAIYERSQKASSDKRAIVVAVPVNLRKMFSSQTLKNFFGVVNVGCKLDESVTFEQLLLSVSEQMKSASDQSYLEEMSRKNVEMSGNLFSRHTPLVLKNMVVSIGFNYMGELKKTMALSNVGVVGFPDGARKYIRHMEFLLYSTPKSPINCSVCTFGDKMCISFTSSVVSVGIIKEFVTSLCEKTDTDAQVYSNMWGEEYEQMQRV